MSTDCENLLRKFLVLNPAKRASLETIMGDKWMNMGFEDDELKPYIEPKQDLADPKRIGKTGTVYKTFSHYVVDVNCCSSIIFFLLLFSKYIYFYIQKATFLRGMISQYFVICNRIFSFRNFSLAFLYIFHF